MTDSAPPRTFPQEKPKILINCVLHSVSGWVWKLSPLPARGVGRVPEQSPANEASKWFQCQYHVGGGLLYGGVDEKQVSWDLSPKF